MTCLELLSPAANLETAIAAIDCGADAVYIGAPHHGARAAASNSVEDIARLCLYAHRYRVRVYVTLNTLVYENELSEVRQLVRELYAAGVDALIVQDMSLLEMDLPPIELHASTQCDIRTPQKARFLQEAGFSQLVLPREMTLDDIKAVRAATSVPLEGFVHGALCVSYSGDCRASFINGGRSANRGECAQICRLPFSLVDGDGKTVVAGRHLLSLKDLNRLMYIREMIEAGITSFKIEGRLKSIEYVRNVTAAYSQALDEIVRSHPDKFRRQSYGKSFYDFEPDVSKAFNRGFTPYFIDRKNPGENELASTLTPKHVGLPVGKVKNSSPRAITLERDADLTNGDGMGFFDSRNNFIGFRINRKEGRTLHLASPLEALPAPGTQLFRNYDKRFQDQLTKSKTYRLIEVCLTLALSSAGITLCAEDERGCRVTVSQDIDLIEAKSPQSDARRRIMGKTGDTIYTLKEFSDNVPDDVFIPASILTELRRKVLNDLDGAARSTYPVRLRDFRAERKISGLYKANLDMHDNVANSLARAFYEKQGAKIESQAVETEKDIPQCEIQVMSSRYCLRRELGACLKTKGASKLKAPVFLRPENRNVRPMRLDFDCAACRMNVIALPHRHFS